MNHKKAFEYVRKGFVDIGCMCGVLSFQFIADTTLHMFLALALIPTNIYLLGHLFYSAIRIFQERGK